MIYQLGFHETFATLQKGAIQRGAWWVSCAIRWWGDREVTIMASGSKKFFHSRSKSTLGIEESDSRQTDGRHLCLVVFCLPGRILDAL